MDAEQTSLIVYTDAQVRAIVANLNASETGVEALRSWVARSCLDADALEETAGRAYLHICGVDSRGRAVVLMLEQHRWSRAHGTHRLHLVEPLSARPTRSSAAAA